ncbi:TetR/AcrR family transcriptional regulator [Nocardia aurantia]|uniref:HTH tetR-type domain-containing protein n=1 Tax=Nocardia aurantia TaxID=2585199 RepID=A0A7K0DTL6_9NOCA|nr:TetR/AcrR family transcriptional regulator [Nocardia aurantia]MQY28174.1 hypothetical protein [Nocardia aurantia]
MTPQTRKERERAERHQRIIDTARELAESDGWETVTIRRLADRIEYSQPVLYSHFAGKRAIVTAVAEQGIAALADTMRAARAAAPTPGAAMEFVARAYLDFATANPALYDAMFLMDTDLTFGLDAPEALRDAFAELEALFRPLVPESELGAYAEVYWSALHGLAALDRGGRLRPELKEQRLAILMRWGGREPE